MEYTIGLSMQVGVPLVAEDTISGSVTGKWEISTSHTDTTTDSTTVTVTGAQAGIVAPGHAADCVATIMNGKFTSVYTAKILMTLASGQTYTTSQRGTFSGSSKLHHFFSYISCSFVPTHSRSSYTVVEWTQ